MDYPVTSRAAFPLRHGVREELLVVGTALGLAVAALLSPLALPLAISGVVFLLAAMRFKLLLLAVVFFLPITPFLNWDFSIRDLSTLVRFSFFAGVLVYRVSHRQEVHTWLWSGWLTRSILFYFAVAIASATVFNHITLDAQRELMRLASYICFYYVVTDWLQTAGDTRALMKTLMASTIVVVLFGCYQAITGGYSALYDTLYPIQEEIRQIPPWEGRITSFLEHYNGLAGYLNLVIPFCIAFAVRGRDSALRRLSRWCFVLASVALLLTQSRGGLLAYAAMLVVSACFFTPDRKSRMRRIAAVLVACLLAGAVAGLFFERLTEIDDFTTVSRLAIWGGAFTVFARAPMIGTGFGNLRALLGGLLNLPDGWTGDAHNLYLELLAETGLAGFLAFTFLIGTTLHTALSGYKDSLGELNRAICFAVFLAIVGMLVHGMVDYIFHTTPQVAALLFLIFGVLRAQSSGSREKSFDG
jgi:putative inorganic carbon (HCO3(-)) transporter